MKAARTKLKAAKKVMAAKHDPKHIGVMVAIGPVHSGSHDSDDEDRANVEGGKAKRRLDRPSSQDGICIRWQRSRS